MRIYSGYTKRPSKETKRKPMKGKECELGWELAALIPKEKLDIELII